MDVVAKIMFTCFLLSVTIFGIPLVFDLNWKQREIATRVSLGLVLLGVIAVIPAIWR